MNVLKLLTEQAEKLKEVKKKLENDFNLKMSEFPQDIQKEIKQILEEKKQTGSLNKERIEALKKKYSDHVATN